MISYPRHCARRRSALTNSWLKTIAYIPVSWQKPTILCKPEEFHSVAENNAARDTEGVELEGLAAAYLHAMEMLHRVRLNFPEPGDDWVIEISDEAGRRPLVVLPASAPVFGRRRQGG
jgi:hypothetical protein